MKRNSKLLKTKMKGQWLIAFQSLAPSLCTAIEKLGQNVPCPVEGGQDGFRLFNDANDTGGGVRHSYRVFPEGIDLLMWVNQWEFTKAFDELDAWLENKPVNSSVVYFPKPKKVDNTWLKNWLNSVWKQSVEIELPKAYPAWAYFNSRGILNAAKDAKDLRMHQKLNYKDDQSKKDLGRFNALICLVRDNNSRPVSIHRTYLSRGGQKVVLKGDHNKPKKMTPSVSDSVGRRIELFEPLNGYLGTCEGLETALAVYEAKHFPTWPVLSNTNLHNFVPPSGVHTIVNFVDKDRPNKKGRKAGEDSALVLEKHLRELGVRVINLLPPTPILDTDEKGVDWADQLKRDKTAFDIIDDILNVDVLEQQA